MKLKLVLYILLTTFSIVAVKAQDPVFTQYYFVPETQNGAFTGTINTLNTGILHRTQWPDGSRRLDTEYAFINGSVGNLSEDSRPYDSNLQNIGIGITVLNQHEVFTNYNYTQINGVTSLNLDLDNFSSGLRLILGLEGGYGLKNFNFKSLLFEDQINTDTGGINGGSADPSLLYLKSKVNFFDISSGFLLYDENFWVGVSFKHLNTPNIAFESEGKVALDINYSIQSGYSFDLDRNPNFGFLPDNSKFVLTSNFMKQGQYNRLDFGSMLHFNPFIIGVIAATNPMRKSDQSHLLTSVNLIGSIKINNFTFGYSYDLSTSKIDNTQGVHEFSLTWQIGRECHSCNNYLVARPWGRNY
ncbi:MAG: PorP/SprF family type IX secretion system membrane protein [Flavobacteriaceae bacterium]|nr:PorP/SprF family type IX secretion system membrane protein [Flavobacteriaceae bacterium]